jgi:hypothetical protein
MINPLAVAVEGFGFGSLSISVLGWLTELEVPGTGVWYVPSDIIFRVGYGKERVIQTYKVWPLHEKVVAKFEGSEAVTKSVKVKLVEIKKAITPTSVRAKKYE